MANVVGTDNSETLNGADGVTNRPDEIYGLGGDDFLYGNGGNDMLKGGGKGNDDLTGDVSLPTCLRYRHRRQRHADHRHTTGWWQIHTPMRYLAMKLANLR
jgi:hypothetical protein